MTPGEEAAKIATVLDYVEAVRERFRRSMDDDDLPPDWSDRPSSHTVHPGTQEILLAPTSAEDLGGGLADAVADPTAGGGHGSAPGLTLRSLASAFQATTGPLSRSWQIDWNGDASQHTRLPSGTWRRGTPSGGANYPWELYWAAGPGLPVPPGLLHYASGRHTLERLATGDVSAAVHAALPTADAGAPRPTGGYLICALRPWKTAFKYGNFAYHLATHDIGAFLGSWQLTQRASGRPGRAVLRFDEPAVNAVLGLDPDRESAYAVLPLEWDPAEHRPARTTVPTAGQARPQPWERSRHVKEFPVLTAMRRATAGGGTGQPHAPSAGHRPMPGPAARTVRLPDAALPATALSELLSRRRSTGGRLDPLAPLTADELAVVLRCAAAAAPVAGDRRLTRIRVIAQRIEGIAPGGYRYDPDEHTLIAAGAAPRLSQQDYVLRNYAVAQAGAVIAFTWRPAPDLAAHGPQAYRVAHAEAGAAAQHLHLAAQAAGLGFGLVLGVDLRAVDRAVGGDGEPELRTSLCGFLGARIRGSAALDERLM
ncbi:nitroreductase family protein [Streptomyces sp. ISL-66]|uniref:nitroreductase family protein n=1 Tax=Streptomyces sp. ISL-66 TaxID=2819186 RepID=UPI001BECA368|nr:nitroreductase family protein [Streptomyces sp. ISL-66]MBT2468154.1 nitroreductase family protein [Streptomyces sp. ISL-66]